MFCFEPPARGAAITPTRIMSDQHRRAAPFLPTRPRLTRAAVVLAAILGLTSPGQAFAHAHLQRATPAADSTVIGSPPALTLLFTEAVEPRFSTVQLQDGQGAPVEIAKPTAQDGGLTLTTPLPKLQPGRFTVIWHATSVDTHKTEGKFTFTVSP